MALNHHKAKKDSNHKEIAEVFEKNGYVIIDTSPLKNACDFIADNGIIIYLIEVKSKYGKLSPGEITFDKLDRVNNRLDDFEYKYHLLEHDLLRCCSGNKSDKINTDEFKTRLTELLHKYNDSQGHIVKSIELNPTIGHVSNKVLYYNVKINIE